MERSKSEQGVEEAKAISVVHWHQLISHRYSPTGLRFHLMTDEEHEPSQGQILGSLRDVLPAGLYRSEHSLREFVAPALIIQPATHSSAKPYWSLHRLGRKPGIPLNRDRVQGFSLTHRSQRSPLPVWSLCFLIRSPLPCMQTSPEGYVRPVNHSSIALNWASACSLALSFVESAISLSASTPRPARMILLPWDTLERQVPIVYPPPPRPFPALRLSVQRRSIRSALESDWSDSSR